MKPYRLFCYTKLKNIIRREKIMSITVLTYEGYIRNRKKIAKDLGIPDTPDSSVETLIITEGFKRWGYDLPDHLNGAFAFVIRDDESGDIFCARDPFGIQSLYYCEADGRLICDTRIKPILSDPGYTKELDEEVLLYHMMFGYPIGEKTLYKGIRKLMPGRYLIYRDGERTIKRYFTPSFAPEEDLSEQEWIDLISDALETILSEERENFNLNGAYSFLSGGVDSSYLLAASGVKNACSIGYRDEEFSEWDLAEKIAAHVGADLLKLEVDAEEFYGAVYDFVHNTELPTADASSIAFTVGCQKLFEQGGRISFSGEGADEFFAGYKAHLRAEELYKNGYCGCAGVIEKNAAKKLLKLNKEYDHTYLTDDVSGMGLKDPLSVILATDITIWLEGDILFGINNASKASGMNILLPLADRRLFELSARIPSRLKIKDGMGKYIFRKAAASVLPHETAWREKKGFPVPYLKWMLTKPVCDKVEAEFFSEEAAQLFDLAILKKYWDSFRSGNMLLGRIIYTAYILLKWYKDVFLKD